MFIPPKPKRGIDPLESGWTREAKMKYVLPPWDKWNIQSSTFLWPIHVGSESKAILEPSFSWPTACAHFSACRALGWWLHKWATTLAGINHKEGCGGKSMKSNCTDCIQRFHFPQVTRGITLQKPKEQYWWKLHGIRFSGSPGPACF